MIKEYDIKEVKALIDKELSSVERAIDESIDSWLSTIPEAIKYLIGSGGKRIRPMFLILVYRSLGGEGEDYIIPSVVSELLHTATLFHDDVIDEAHYRRGKPSVNRVFGNLVSVLVGDFLLAVSFQNILRIPYDYVKDELAATTRIMAEGEVFQAIKRWDIDTSLDDYERIIYSKTSALFRWCAFAGASLAGVSYDGSKEIGELGTHFGMIFQMKDDILDYTGKKKEVGKDTLKDLKEGHITLPVIVAMDKDSRLRKEIENFFDEDKEYELNEGLIKDIVLSYIDEAYDRMNTWYEKANGIIDKFPNNEYKKALKELFSFIRYREY